MDQILSGKMLRNSAQWTVFMDLRVGGEMKNIPIECRVDPFFPTHGTIISRERAKRPMKKTERIRHTEAELQKEKEACKFEPHNAHCTPQPQEHHEELSYEGYCPVSFDNISPFALDHRVNCYAPHEKKYPEMLMSRDFENYLAISIKNARAILKKGYSAMFSFINIGLAAGGTQPHPHSQEGIRLLERSSLESRERMFFSLLENDVDDPFHHYFQYSLKQGLCCLETSEIFMTTPYAPRFPDQIDLYVKPACANFIHLKGPTCHHLAKGLYHAVQFLSTQRNVDDFNIVAHLDSLESSSGYRLHFHILPRNLNIFASFESDGLYVVDRFPEETASSFRTYLSKHAQ